MGDWNKDLPDLREFPASSSPAQTLSLLLNPPSQIPGAEDVKHVINPTNPALRIFFIQDYHGGSLCQMILSHLYSSGAANPTLPPDERARIVAKFNSERSQVEVVQNNIKEILKFLSSNYGIDGVWKEGSFPETVSGRMNLLNDFKRDGFSLALKSRQRISQAWSDHDAAFNQFKLGTTSYGAYKKALQDALVIQDVLGGAMVFNAIEGSYLDGVVKHILPGESRLLHQQGLKLSQEPIDSRLLLINGEFRERFLLRNMVNHAARHGSNAAVFVFGGMHGVSDNVLAFNQSFPDSKIALSILTPAGFTENLRKQIEEQTRALKEQKARR
jgi:hypothetical protein